MSPGSVCQLPRRGVKFPSAEEEDTRTTPRPSHLRPVVSVTTAAMMHSNARARSDLVCATRRASLARSMMKLGITLPPDNYPLSQPGEAGPEFLLDTPLRKALSEYPRRSGASLQTFVEMVRGQTANDYRPNKNLVPAVLNKVCKGYERLEELQQIVHGGVQVRLSKTPPQQVKRPPNHGSARDRLNVLHKNIRKEQDAGRCLVLDRDLLEQWPEIIISPFGVVDKGGEDASVTGRTIHDLSYPEGTSINDCTDQDSIIKPDYTYCEAVATEILKSKRAHPNARVCVMAGDVASAFRNISIHSNSVYLFAGHIEEDDIIVIELAAPFGWTGSPGFYEIAGGAVAYVHGSHTTDEFPDGMFNYHWVDDHINVAADAGTACDDATGRYGTPWWRSWVPTPLVLRSSPTGTHDNAYWSSCSILRRKRYLRQWRRYSRLGELWRSLSQLRRSQGRPIVR
ncbi:hypothetical protein PF007_g24202 [Phytophthora fragariae]|uniref:Uncharacterized protein n=1 Tax=Phytophthora fragariae TaxID=53985 RepID=A0A6A3QKJ6_9STRA|nr:hypothetical protein PF007_g24202 [Phytophthora fragariae]